MWGSLCQDSTIHPVHHGVCIRRPLSKVLWMFYCVLLLVFFNVAVYFLAVQYGRLHNERVEWSPQSAFPEVVVCPNNWVDLDRAREAGMDSELLQYVLGFMGVLAHETEIHPYADIPFYDLWKQESLKTKFEELMLNFTTLSELLKNISLTPDRVAIDRQCQGCAEVEQVQPLVKSAYVCYSLLLVQPKVGSTEALPRRLSFRLFPHGGQFGLAQLLFGPLAKKEHDLNSLMVHENISFDITLRAFRFSSGSHKQRSWSDSLTCEQQCLLAVEDKHQKRIRYYMGEEFDEPRSQYVHGNDESWLSTEDLKVTRLSASKCRNARCSCAPVTPIVYDIMATSFSPSVPSTASIKIRLGLGGMALAVEKPNFGDVWIFFLADFGGLLALFFGASITSLLHFLYSLVFTVTGGYTDNVSPLIPGGRAVTPESQLAHVENGTRRGE